MERNTTITKDFVEALCLYVEAMNNLNKQYIQAVADINEMFNKRIEGMKEDETHYPVQ